MQHRKDGLYQPNPFSLVNSDYQQNLTKEIKDFFGDISFEEVQEELFEISRMLVTKETLKNYSVLSVRERGYTLQRVLMLLTRLHFINSKPESNGTN
jgi:biotin operon repressor